MQMMDIKLQKELEKHNEQRELQSKQMGQLNKNYLQLLDIIK